MFIICLHTKFYIASCNNALLIDVKLRDNSTFWHGRHAAVLHTEQNI